MKCTITFLGKLAPFGDFTGVLTKRQPYLSACRKAVWCERCPKNPNRIYERGEKSAPHDQALDDLTKLPTRSPSSSSSFFSALFSAMSSSESSMEVRRKSIRMYRRKKTPTKRHRSHTLQRETKMVKKIVKITITQTGVRSVLGSRPHCYRPVETCSSLGRRAYQPSKAISW